MAERNYRIDELRIFAAFAVCYIHFGIVGGAGPLGGICDDYIRAICRFAVPLFFMITGFYLPDFVKNGKQFLQICKILKISIWATLLYIIENICYHYIDGDMMAWLSKTFSKSALLELLIFQSQTYAVHLWYLYALLYSLAFIFIFTLFVQYETIVKYYTPVSFAILIICYVPGLFFSRNYITAIPCILLGSSTRIFGIGRKVKKPLRLTLLFIILSGLELFILRQYTDKIYDLNLFCIPIAWMLLLWATNEFTVAKHIDNVFALLGRRYTTSIYIFHLLVGHALKRMEISPGIQICLPIIVFVITLGISMLLYCLKEALMQRRCNY